MINCLFYWRSVKWQPIKSTIWWFIGRTLGSMGCSWAGWTYLWNLHGIISLGMAGHRKLIIWAGKWRFCVHPWENRKDQPQIGRLLISVFYFVSDDCLMDIFMNAYCMEIEGDVKLLSFHAWRFIKIDLNGKKAEGWERWNKNRTKKPTR